MGKLTGGQQLERALARKAKSKARDLRWDAANATNQARAILALFRSPRQVERRADRRKRIAEVCKAIKAKLRAWHKAERARVLAELRARQVAERAALAERCRATKARAVAQLNRPKDRAAALRRLAASYRREAAALRAAHATQAAKIASMRARETIGEALNTARASIEANHPELLGLFDDWSRGTGAREAFKSAREELQKQGRNDPRFARAAKSAQGVGEQMAIRFVERITETPDALYEWEQRQMGTDAEHQASYLASEAKARGVTVAQLMTGITSPPGRKRRARSSYVEGVPF